MEGESGPFRPIDFRSRVCRLGPIPSFCKLYSKEKEKLWPDQLLKCKGLNLANDYIRYVLISNLRRIHSEESKAGGRAYSAVRGGVRA